MVVEVGVDHLDVGGRHAAGPRSRLGGRELLPRLARQQPGRAVDEIDVALEHISSREPMFHVGPDTEILERQAGVAAHTRRSANGEAERRVARQPQRQRRGVGRQLRDERVLPHVGATGAGGRVDA
jgi:hypothetical protein